jgi:hypothetical protein
MLLSVRGFVLLSFLGSFMLLSLVNHVNAEPKVVSMQTKRMPRSRALQKRDEGEVTIYNYDSGYFLETAVGTPGQNIFLQIDTGSSDTWMFSSALEDDSYDQDSSVFCKCNNRQQLKWPRCSTH